MFKYYSLAFQLNVSRQLDDVQLTKLAKHELIVEPIVNEPQL